MTESNTVGPILVAVDKPRVQLLTEAELVTFRGRDRTTGETWWRKSRTGEKKGDVTVSQIEECDPSQEEVLEPFAELSGFDSVGDWQAAIKDLHGSLEMDGYLYRVAPTRGNCAKCGEQKPLPLNEMCPECSQEEARAVHYSREAKGHAR